MAGEGRGKGVVAGVEPAAGPGPSATRAAPVSVAMSTRMSALLVGERQRIGEDEPALGVGVADLDGEALAAPEDVAGPEGGAGDGEFSTAGMSTRRSTFSPASMIMWARPMHIGRAAHVLLHQEHGGGRLDVEAAGIEAHALADQRHAL
jgi:hypothetical protein